jgi:UDP-2-acetamido-2,6-beta-L-arabino-hexul-4-ose reductase
MSTIGITGSDGFLGWHLRCALHADRRESPALAPRRVFDDDDALARFAGQCGTIVHLAGLNRGADAVVEATNIALTRRLVAALEAARAQPHVILSSSTHQALDTAYGRSKRVSAELISDWAARSGGVFTNLVLPNVFGECGRPHYNSVVATFCHQIAGGESPRVIVDKELDLVHAQRAAQEILRVAARPAGAERRVSGMRLTVSGLLARLDEMACAYAGHRVPPLATAFDLELFNTYRSFLFPGGYPMTLELKADRRGTLYEAVKSEREGQCFLSTTVPGATRGNHYHKAKIERFLVVAGEAVIRVRRLFAGEVVEYRVSGKRPQYVDMPTLHTHNITNVGAEPLITLFWSHEIFDPARPDTYAEQV